MERSPLNKQGFMLIEVLISLFIIALLMIAFIKATTDDTRNMIIIKNKTIASWAASNLLANIQLGLLSPGSNKTNLTVNMLGQNWYEVAIFTPLSQNTWQIDIEIKPTSFKTQSSLHVTTYYSNDVEKGRMAS